MNKKLKYNFLGLAIAFGGATAYQYKSSNDIANEMLKAFNGSPAAPVLNFIYPDQTTTKTVGLFNVIVRRDYNRPDKECSLQMKTRFGIRTSTDKFVRQAIENHTTKTDCIELQQT